MTNFSRPDVYRNIHKAIRKAMFDFAYTLGRLDIEQAPSRKVMKDRFDELVHLLDMHGHKEDVYSLPLLEMKKPGSTRHNEEEHVQIHGEIEGLKLQLSSLLDATPEIRRDIYWNFYYAINKFISGYLMHMQMEEIVMTNLFYELCSDDEIMGMTAAIIGSLTPADSMLVARFMIPSIEPFERLHMMSQIQVTAPPQAFEALLNLCREILSAEEFEALQNGLFADSSL
ncbi:MAG: hemerythrin domain-containing protein [Bacteroidetes bacterium]|nr:hemerythrin domain-containing protein [Bacteroidota bacterium]